MTGCNLKFVYIYLFICGWVGDGGAGWCLYGQNEGVSSLYQVGSKGSDSVHQAW